VRKSYRQTEDTHWSLDFAGGDRLKFGNIILTVASVAVVDIMLYFLLGLALIPSIGSYWGLNSAGIVSLLIAAIVVGYIFAGKIVEESKMRTIGKISVLFGWMMSWSVALGASANGYYNAWADETLKSMFSTSAWTTTDWYIYGQMVLMTNIVLNVILGLVLTFVGLYVGSMLRKPRQS
jgi:hypothetical protein